MPRTKGLNVTLEKSKIKTFTKIGNDDIYKIGNDDIYKIGNYDIKVNRIFSTHVTNSDIFAQCHQM